MGQDRAHPNNSIIAEDNGLIIEEFEVGANATAAKMLPGTAVILDTVAGDVKEAGAKATGVIGWLIEAPDGAITTAYAVGDTCRVVTGGYGKLMVRRVANAGNITQGTPLVTAADGLAALMAVGAMGSQGDVIAIGAEILADSTAIANVLVEVHKSVQPLAAS